ncbi:LLM class flavin-dependent oxidoreductase, partial [bacterium M00.F.Ca.ET.163.01.1.1]
PKVDFFEDHAFVAMRMIDDVTAHRYEQIAVFFGRNFVVTFQEREGDPFDPVRKRIAAAMPNRLRSRGAEFTEVVKALWDSWEDDAFVGNKAQGRFVDVAKVHPIEHRGRHFDVQGALNLPRPP